MEPLEQWQELILEINREAAAGRFVEARVCAERALAFARAELAEQPACVRSSLRCVAAYYRYEGREQEASALEAEAGPVPTVELTPPRYEPRRPPPAELPQAPARVLAGAGIIRSAGGCEVYTQAEVRLEPVGERVRVDIDNRQRHFYDLPATIEVELDAAEVARMLGALQQTMSDTERSGRMSTRGAVVEVDLPLEGEHFHARAEEMKGTPPIEPVLETLRWLEERVAALVES